LIGAYDIDHPTLLITNTFSPTLTSLVQGADRVGLKVRCGIAVIDFEINAMSGDFMKKSLFKLSDFLSTPTVESEVGSKGIKTVLDWLNQHRQQP
jgi:hypothetical protein